MKPIVPGKPRDYQDEQIVKHGIELLKGEWQKEGDRYVLPIEGVFQTRGVDVSDIRRALEHLDIVSKKDTQFTNYNPNTSLPVYVSADDANDNNQLVMNPEKYKELQDALKFIAQQNAR